MADRDLDVAYVAKLARLRLTAEEASGLLERGELSATELRGAYLDAIADRDGELHCFLRTVDEPIANSSVFVLPRRESPEDLARAATVASKTGT